MDQFTVQDDLGHLIKKHDQEAFHELYRTSFNKLQQYAMRYLYDWDDAEDLVQDAFPPAPASGSPPTTPSPSASTTWASCCPE